FLDLGVDLRPDGQRVHQHPHLVRHHLEPRGHGALAGLGPRDDERRHLEELGRDLNDVVLADPVGRDVDLLAVHREVAVRHQLAGHVTALGEAGPEHHVDQAALKQLEHGLAGTAVLAGLLRSTRGTGAPGCRRSGGPSASPGSAAGSRLPSSRSARAHPAGRAGSRSGTSASRTSRPSGRAWSSPGGTACSPGLCLEPSVAISSSPQTRRRFGGRQPLCGTGVMSWIEPTSRPVACSDLMAVSRPEPGPLTKTSTLRMPCSMARRAAASAAICAAYGVDLRDPLNPTWPADAHEMTFPVGSVIEMIVLLNVLLM